MTCGDDDPFLRFAPHLASPQPLDSPARTVARVDRPALPIGNHPLTRGARAVDLSSDSHRARPARDSHQSAFKHRRPETDESIRDYADRNRATMTCGDDDPNLRPAPHLASPQPLDSPAQPVVLYDRPALSTDTPLWTRRLVNI